MLPYERRLFPGTLEAIAHLKRFGELAILSDGDPVFQPAKVARAGLAEAVNNRVLIYVHKEQHLGELMRRFPAERYVHVDDKPRILAATKLVMGAQLITLHVCQGKYAHAAEHELYPAPDLAVDTIADVRRLGMHDFDTPRS